MMSMIWGLKLLSFQPVQTISSQKGVLGNQQLCPHIASFLDADDTNALISITKSTYAIRERILNPNIFGKMAAYELFESRIKDPLPEIELHKKKWQQLSNAQRVQFPLRVTQIDFRFLSRDLYFSSSSHTLSEDDISKLVTLCPNVKSFIMPENMSIDTQGGIDALSKWKCIRHLDLGNTHFVNPFHQADHAYYPFYEFYSKNPLNMDALRGCPLESLHLNKDTPNVIQTNHPLSLRSLTISEFSDYGHEDLLLQFKNLENIKIIKFAGDNSGISFLTTAFPNLKTLSITNGEFLNPDKALGELLGKRGLKWEIGEIGSHTISYSEKCAIKINNALSSIFLVIGRSLRILE